eukprot:12987061-Alexandrium_andersonii.AAC.1
MRGCPRGGWPVRPGTAATKGTSSPAGVGAFVLWGQAPLQGPGGGDACAHRRQCRAGRACSRCRPRAATPRMTWAS